MNLRALLAAAPLAAALFASPTLAAIGDPCTPDVVDAEGNVTEDNFTERCEGTNVVGCFPPVAGGADVETAQDCAALFTGAPVGSCELFDFGPRCAFADGDECVFASADNPFIPFPCSNASSGCINFACTAGVGGCTPGESECLVDGQAAFCAPWGQHVGVDCSGWAELDGVNVAGGTLECVGAGTCSGIGEGGTCDDAFYFCAEGDCLGETCFSGGGEEGEGEGGEGEGGEEGEGEGGFEGEGEGDSEPECEDDSDCASDEECSNSGNCVEEDECEDDNDCDDDEECNSGECERLENPPFLICGGASAPVPLAALLMLLVLRRRKAQ